jgi:hypothetical protein
MRAAVNLDHLPGSHVTVLDQPHRDLRDVVRCASSAQRHILRVLVAGQIALTREHQGASGSIRGQTTNILPTYLRERKT